MPEQQQYLNGDLSLEKPKDQGRVTLKDRLSHFTWAWFACTMSTGALATLISQQPFRFDGLKILGSIVFIIDLVLFVIFCACIGFRFFMHPHMFMRSMHHPTEGFFFGTFWVSVGLIIDNIQQYGVPHCGEWLITTLKILYWIFAGCVILVAVFQYHALFDKENLPVTEHALPSILLIMYPFLILGPLAAALNNSQPQEAALPILIAGITFQGLGWTFAFMIYTIFLTRLMQNDPPPPNKRPGMYVSVGPAAYTSYAFVLLGSQAPGIVPDNYLGITGIPVGQVWYALGVPAGIFVWLLGFWFCAVTTISVVSGLRQMSFTLNCWAFIFPNAGLMIALIQIGSALDSTGIKAVAAAGTIILVILWLTVAALNIKGVLTKQILWPGKDEDAKNMQGEEDDRLGYGKRE